MAEHSRQFDYTPASGRIRCHHDSHANESLKATGMIDMVWCEHLEEYTRSGEDAALIWYRPEGERYHDEMRLEIPISPTNNLWTEVRLILETSFHIPMYEVFWSAEDPFNPDTASAICYISPGEGRNVIRDTLFQHVWTQTDRPKICDAGTHQFEAEMIWQDNMKTAMHILDEWCLLVYGACLHCTARMNEDSDDLIPDLQGNPWNV